MAHVSCSRRSLVSRMLPAATLLALVAAPLTAQGARKSSTKRDSALIAQSDAALAEANRRLASNDSAGAVLILRDAATADPNYAPLWHAYGTLLSAQTRYAWGRGGMPSGVSQIIIAAESSLARATRLAPDSTRYAMAYANHIASAHPTSFRKATDLYKKLMERPGADATLLAEASNRMSVILWRQFEPMIGKGLPLEQNLLERIGRREEFVNWVRRNYRPPATMFGLDTYQEALRYARYARETNPDDERHFRNEQMILAELSRWQEMEQIARGQIRLRRAQPWPWLVVGMTEQRKGRSAQAHAAFDSGFARLPETDRIRLESAMRHMLPKRVTWYDTLSQGARDQLHTLFWNNSDPSFLQSHNVVRTEFLARVVYTELRFSDESRAIHGSNSDKGEIYIRYGPPDVVMRTAEGIDDNPAQCNFAEGTDTMKYNIGRPEFAPDCYNTVQMWVYYNDILHFRFGQNRGNSNARMMKDSRVLFDSTALDRPTGFSNVPLLRHRVDSIAAQVVRFRTTSDSVDYAVFSAVRAGALRRETPLESSTIRYGVFLVDGLGRELLRTPSTFTTGDRDTVALHPKNTFLRSAVPATSVRLEALEPDLHQAARSIVSMPAFATSGFGTSELLIARSVEPPSDKQNARWSDYAIAPFTGNIVQRGEPIALLWETYSPGATNGVAKLRVSVTVVREEGTGLVAIAGRVLSGVREALTGDRSSSQVSIAYTREVSAASHIVDHLKVDLGTLDAGRYRARLSVTDLVTNASTEQSQRFVIVR